MSRYNLRARKSVDYNEIVADYEIKKSIDKHQENDDDYIPSNDELSHSDDEEEENEGEDEEEKEIVINNYPMSKIKQFLATMVKLVSKNIFSPLCMIFMVSVYTRFKDVNDTHNPIVVWDEAHFGKFANFYLQKKFYFDVHPPLGKMIIFFISYMFNYDGSFAFESGSLYNDNVPIKKMRMCSAIFGAMISPLMYGTLRNLKIKKSIATVVASMTIFDNALLVISKFVLLDSMLMFFTMLSIYFATSSLKKSRESFSTSWKAYMFLTGVSLGMTLSVKWVGLFTYAFVGLFIVKDLWNLLPLFRYSPKRWKNHFVYRTIFLIIVPFTVYYGSFVMHFKILENSGPGDAQMSTMFQACLKNSSMPKFAQRVSLGSMITIVNQGSHYGILHSHSHKYPEGSHQLQITLYHHKDVNNWFKILPLKDASTSTTTKTQNKGILYDNNEKIDDNVNVNEMVDKKENENHKVDQTDVEIDNLKNLISDWIHGQEKNENNENKKYTHIRHNTIIRLNHNTTRSNLHSHNVNAYLSSFDNEVSGYGSEKSGDDNDLWMVEIVNSEQKYGHSNDIIYNVITIVRFKHVKTGCYLTSSGKKLPHWGYEQLEVTCTFKPDSNSLWNFQDIYNDNGNNGENDIDGNGNNGENDGHNVLIESFCLKQSMMRNFWDLNVAMYRANNALTKKPGNRDLLISEPIEWVFMQKGIRMCNWNDDTKKYYMLGNPLVWWSSSLSLVAFFTNFSYLVVKSKMGQTVSLRDERFMQLGSLLLGGWVLHFAPFFIMGRVTYLHHYFPALLISMLTTGLMFDRWIPNIKRNLIEATVISIYAGSFYYFSPLSYGFKGSADTMKGRQWLSGWNLGDLRSP